MPENLHNQMLRVFCEIRTFPKEPVFPYLHCVSGAVIQNPFPIPNFYPVPLGPIFFVLLIRPVGQRFVKVFAQPFIEGSHRYIYGSFQELFNRRQCHLCLPRRYCRRRQVYRNIKNSPPRGNDQGNYGKGPFGGNPSNPEVVYCTKDKKSAIDRWLQSQPAGREG